jgi:CRP-like cAMP-binding protein
MDLLLKAIKQYINVQPEEEAVIAGLFTGMRLKAGDHFLREGQVCRYVAFVASGLVRYYLTHEGLEKTLFFSREGEFVSEYESFLPQKPSAKNIQALEDTHMYVITRENLERFYREIKEGERFGRLGIEWVFVEISQQLDSLYVDTPEMRYKRFLETYASLTQRIPQYYIASYVGVQAPSLSRIRRRLLNSG